MNYSIVMPVYKRLDIIELCLDSINEQKFRLIIPYNDGVNYN